MHRIQFYTILFRYIKKKYNRLPKNNSDAFQTVCNSFLKLNSRKLFEIKKKLNVWVYIFATNILCFIFQSGSSCIFGDSRSGPPLRFTQFSSYLKTHSLA